MTTISCLHEHAKSGFFPHIFTIYIHFRGMVPTEIAILILVEEWYCGPMIMMTWCCIWQTSVMMSSHIFSWLYHDSWFYSVLKLKNKKYYLLTTNSSYFKINNSYIGIEYILMR